MTYMTTQGETWDWIAHQALGNVNYMPDMIKANPNYAHVAVFSGGIVLTVPTIAPEASTDLPPWKRDD